MKLGMFMMPYHDPRRDLHQALHEDVEVAVHADRAGMLSMLKTDKAMPDAAVTPDYALRSFAICGSPQRVAEQIRDLRAEVGDFRGLVALAVEFGDRAKIFDSMSLLSGEVRPLLAA